jgi:hypothetical protein
MNTPLTSGKSPLSGRGIALTVTLAILVPIALQKASAKGGTFHLWSAWSPVSRAQAATVTSPRAATETHSPTILGSCGGKRYRDPNTHRCRGPADFGN